MRLNLIKEFKIATFNAQKKSIIFKNCKILFYIVIKIIYISNDSFKELISIVPISKVPK